MRVINVINRDGHAKEMKSGHVSNTSTVIVCMEYSFSSVMKAVPNYVDVLLAIPRPVCTG